MGEIFQRERSEEPLAWTGERLVTGIAGPIEDEHLHRYFLARSLCPGKVVLDIASGEGYGSALLAQTARRVIGVELDAASVQHAARAYRAVNLQYLQGDATQIPLAAGSVDVVVSFETLEHFMDHEAFLAEVRRVLIPSGLLLISTPESDTYSGAGTRPNLFHRRELTREEFAAELRLEFQHVVIFGQRAFSGSAILPEATHAGSGQTWIYEQRGTDTFETHRQLPHPPYLLAIASNREAPMPVDSLYIRADRPAEDAEQVAKEIERLQGVEASAREQALLFQQALAESAAAKQEVMHAATKIAALETELQRVGSEVVYLRNTESAFRQQTERLAEAQRREAALIAEVERREAAATTDAERRAAELMAEAERREALLMGEKEEALAGTERIRQQFAAANLMVRQQALVARRLQQDLFTQTRNFQAVESDLARLRVAYDDICRLIIPPRMRKLVPPSLRNPLRAIKRAVTR